MEGEQCGRGVLGDKVKPEEEKCGESGSSVKFPGTEKQVYAQKETWRLLPEGTEEQSATQKFPVASSRQKIHLEANIILELTERKITFTMFRLLGRSKGTESVTQCPGQRISKQ